MLRTTPHIFCFQSFQTRQKSSRLCRLFPRSTGRWFLAHGCQTPKAGRFRLQIRLALELSRRSDEHWRKMTAAFREDRVAFVAALRRRDRAQAIDAMKRYQT